MNLKETCTCSKLNENERKKRKGLNLGVTKFMADSAPEVDPIIDMFHEYTWSVNNTQTKQTEQMSLFKLINSRIDSQDSTFKRFPPSVLPKPDLGIFLTNYFLHY